jgi:hypothetical protein
LSEGVILLKVTYGDWGAWVNATEDFPQADVIFWDVSYHYLTSPPCNGNGCNVNDKERMEMLNNENVSQWEWTDVGWVSNY